MSQKKLSLLICNNSIFNWDSALISCESSLTCFEPQAREVYGSVCLPELMVPPFVLDLGGLKFSLFPFFNLYSISVKVEIFLLEPLVFADQR